MRATPSRRWASDGYAVIDALMALMILALTSALSIRAMEMARRAAELAQETRRADSLLIHVLETASRDLGVMAGRTDGFVWSVATEVTGAERPIVVCRRAATLTNLASGRVYAASTYETCPPEAVS